jgi:hypothetical protein
MTSRRILLSIAVLITVSAAAVFAAHQLLAPKQPGLAGMMPDGALLYIESPDFHALLSDWTNSPEKQAWLKSDNYAVFSQSRLFGRLSQAQDEFATAAGLPPDMQFVSQVAGSESAFAWYDIGNLEFLYITRLPSATFSQSTLWQSRGKFETRQSGKVQFYLRTDPQSQRTAAFASVDDWVILGTREDLVASAVALIGGEQARSIHDEPWYSDSLAAAKAPGDLRMVLNLEKIVPSPYFRSYWIQQNITDMKQYRAAISDLYRSKQVYKEERVLLRKNVPDASQSSADISQLAGAVPAGTGFYKAIAAPSPKQTVDILRDKLLDPRPHSDTNYKYAPPAPVTDQNAGAASDLETYIDQAPAVTKLVDPWQPLQSLIEAAQVSGMLVCESSALKSNETFARFHSAIVLTAEHDWNVEQLKSTLSSTLEFQLTASQLGLGWANQQGYAQFDGLLPLALSVKGKFLILSNDPALLLAVQDQLNRKPASSEPAVYVSGLNHTQEKANFLRVTTLVDRAGMRGGPTLSDDPNEPRRPAFFSGNVASFSQVFSAVASESIVVRNAGPNVTQTVTYQWQQ